MFYSQIKQFLFYKHIFTLGNIFRSGSAYFFYILAMDKAYLNPVTINFLITSRCNLGCNICSFHAGRNMGFKALTLQDVEEFLVTQLKFKPFIFFSGGEPFMRGDFIDILKAVKKYKFKCGVNSNAYMLDRDKIKKIISLGLELIIFSLYGQEDVHDTITGVKGSYAKSAQNISLFCKNKNKISKVILSCAITKTNIDSLEKIPVIAKNLGVDAVKFEHLNFLSNLEADSNSGCRRSLNNFIADFGDFGQFFADNLIGKLTVIKKEYGNFVFVKPDLTKEEIRSWYSNEFRSRKKCFFTWHSVFIRPDGVIVPCQFLLKYELGNIKEHKIDDIFRSPKAQELRKSLKKQLWPECSRCCKL